MIHLFTLESDYPQKCAPIDALNSVDVVAFNGEDFDAFADTQLKLMQEELRVSDERASTLLSKSMFLQRAFDNSCEFTPQS